MNKVQRKYTTKDVEMLVSASTIIDAAIANKALLQSKRSTWADPFFENIKTAIDSATEEHLGVDSAKELREATIAVGAIQVMAIKDLAEVKVQISEDFKNNKTLQGEILTQLGFSSYLAEVQKNNQEALINLLYQFKKNLTPELKTKIVTQGTSAAVLDTITGYADSLKAANVLQESNKGTRKEITSEGITAFNNIYDTVISICKIASKFYKETPAVQQQFSFSKVTKSLSVTKKAPAK
jgi:hypothetical protein